MGFAPQREPDVGGRAARAWLCRCMPAERAQRPWILDEWLVADDQGLRVLSLFTLRGELWRRRVAGATHGFDPPLRERQFAAGTDNRAREHALRDLHDICRASRRVHVH